MQRGAYSVVHQEHAWFVLARADELGGKPLSRSLHGLPIALFRDSKGKAHALSDRCPHRNLPLSAGWVKGDALQCKYHGWCFDGRGACREVPGLVGEPTGKGRQADFHAVREQDGFVWVYSTKNVEPRNEPYRFRFLEESGYSHVRHDVRLECTLHAAAENALDVPHTAFLHGGLFRTAEKGSEIEAVVKIHPDRVEAEYLGEPRPKGIAGKLVAPGGGTVRHFDRFVLPCVTEVEYQLGDRSHLVTVSALTPVDDFVTHLYAVVSFRLPLPAFLVKLFARPLGLRILHQDRDVLSLQTGNVKRFSGERYVSTEIDVLGLQIWQLLRAAARAEGEPVAAEDEAAPKERRVKLLV